MYAKLVHRYACAYQESRVCIDVCWFVCVCMGGWGGVLNLHVKALLRALVCMILWLNHNAMDEVNVVIFYLEIICGTTHEFLPGNNTDL